MGALIGRVVPRDARKTQSEPIASSAPSVATHADHSCIAERAELSSIKTQLAICMAFDPRKINADPKTPTSVPPTAPQHTARDADEIKRNRKLLRTYPEAVIVQHVDGRTGVYRPHEWPIDGDGIIVARKLSGGEIAWYAGPDAGPRSDPSAFQPSSTSADFVAPVIERAPDGTIMVNGEPADDAVQRMFGGKVRPEQGDVP
jgi:hypothetical protein